MLIELIKKYDSKNKLVSYLEFWLSESFEFKAWQFVMLSYEKFRRAYSIASTPDLASKWRIWFYVKKASEAWMSNFLTQDIKIWTKIDMSRAFWHMCLPENQSDWSYLLISTGSGLAPVYSIFQDLVSSWKYLSIDHVFGERNMESIVPEIFSQISKDEISVKSTVYLSRQSCSEACKWYVQDSFPELIDNIHNPEKLKVYICWKPSIVDEISQSLISLWVLAENIKSEKF